MDARLLLAVVGAAVVAVGYGQRFNTGTGTYSFSYDTPNGQSRQESGTQNNGQITQGGWRYTSPEGVSVDITFVADHSGYHPRGAVLPVAPPLPYQRSGN